MHLALIALLAILPPLGLCTFFYLQDRWEPEPHGHVAAAFGLGLLAVAPAILFAQLLERALPALAANPLSDAFLLAGGVEEAVKLAVLLLTAYTWDEFDEPYDGIVYAVALALGFATTENLLYVARGGVVVAALRALFTVPGHALVGATVGYYAGRAKFAPTRPTAALLIALGFAVAALLHGTFDYVVLTTTGWRALTLLSVLSAALWVLVMRRV